MFLIYWVSPVLPAGSVCPSEVRGIEGWVHSEHRDICWTWMNRLIALFYQTSLFPFVFALIGWLRGHVVQVLEREKLNKSELLDNFLRLIQAWTGPLGCIMVAQREVATAAAPTCHSAYVFYTEARDRAHKQPRNGDHFLLRVAMRTLMTEAIKSLGRAIWPGCGQLLWMSEAFPL